MAVRLDRDADGGGELGEPLPDPPGGVAADGVAVAYPRRPGLLGGERELQQVPVVGPRSVLRVDANAVLTWRASGTTSAGRARHRDGRRHLLDDRRAVQPAAELVRDHLVRGGDGQVVVSQSRPVIRPRPDRHGGLDVRGHGPAPAGQPQPAERARLRQRQARPDVGHLVEQEGEPDLGLRHPQPPEVEVDHHLAELRQARPRGLHPVPVGHVKKVDRWHTSRLTRQSTRVNID